MRRRWLLAAAALAVGACGELSGPRAVVRLSIVPVFDAAGAFADNADQLHVVLRRVTDSAVVKDTVLSIDPVTGTADATMSVLILSNPQLFIVALEAIRSSDGAVLFSGESVVSVSSGSGPSGGSTPVQIPVSYEGPKGTAVVIAPRDTTIVAGGTFVLRATVFGTTGTVAAPVTWALVTPADSVTLRVSHGTGVVLAGATASGTVKVFASSPDNLRDTTTVSVGSATAAVSSVTVTPATPTIAIGGTQQLTAVLKDAGGNTLSGRTITWSSATPATATVSATGLVTGVAAGAVVVTATSEGKSGSSTVTVSLAAVASVTVTPSPASIQIGATQQFTATLRDAANNVLTGRTVTWSSSLPGVASVNSSGLATGIAAGTATITATSGVSGTATLNVLPTVAGVKLVPGFAAIGVAGTQALTATIVDPQGNPISGQTITWTSRTAGVATVSASGVVTGVASGTSVIVATNSGFSDSMTIAVATAGNVVASTTAGALRAFAVQKVGDTVTVTLTADMTFTPSEKLGAYDATITWTAARMQFIDVINGPVFAGPVVNSNNAGAGSIQLSGADASSNAVGQVVIARVRFKALSTGNVTPTIVFQDMSGQLQGGSSTVLDSRISVINGTITIVP